jgi:hypothetical protein
LVRFVGNGEFRRSDEGVGEMVGGAHDGLVLLSTRQRSMMIWEHAEKERGSGGSDWANEAMLETYGNRQSMQECYGRQRGRSRPVSRSGRAFPEHACHMFDVGRHLRARASVDDRKRKKDD